MGMKTKLMVFPFVYISETKTMIKVAPMRVLKKISA